MAGKAKSTIPWVTMAGLVLLLGPLTTMAHEIGGHVTSCLALGGHATEVGAFYVECVGASKPAERLVAMAGSGADILIFVIAYAAWTRARGDLARLVLWLVFTVTGMVAGGYWLFSGVTGIGDWGPGIGGGIGPLDHEYAWRAGLAVFGGASYYALIRLSLRSLRSMVGGGATALANQQRIALGFYCINGAVAVLVGLFNPHGLFITLASAAASSFGGTAGMFNIAYDRSDAPPRAFTLKSYPLMLVAGVIVAGAFGAVLGPTLYFAH
jgi:hypothetical protein